MITIVKSVRTCLACPAQWDAWDEHGFYYYMRYRHGCGQVRLYVDTPLWTVAPIHLGLSDTVAEFEYGGPYDGHMQLDQFCRLAGLTLDYSGDHKGWGEYASKLLTEALEERKRADGDTNTE